MFRSRWMCHFDDDNYVNVPRLVRLLQGYDPREDWYLGKPSIRQPLEILARDKGSRQVRTCYAFANHAPVTRPGFVGR